MTPAVPFLDVRAAHRELSSELAEATERVMSSGMFILGPEVDAFEQEFAAYCRAQHAIGVANGLEALELVLRAWGVGAGDEVIVPSNTFIATWLAVERTGAQAVPVEPDDVTFNLEPANVLRAMTSRTKVLIPVHLYGRLAPMGPLLDLARSKGLYVLEDAAQAHGAQDAGYRAGSSGDAAAFSFYPGKNLGALGDGGAVTTDNADLADHLRALRNYGSRVKYRSDILGTNSRLDTLQAAFLRAKLPRLDAWNERRRGIAARYHAALRDVPGLRLPSMSQTGNVWHLYVVRHAQRDRLQRELGERGVNTLIHYPIPPHRSGAFAPTFGTANLPIADALAAEVLSLPMGPHLSDHDVSHVIRATLDACSVLEKLDGRDGERPHLHANRPSEDTPVETH